MRAMVRIHAGIGQPQPLHRPAMYQMLPHNLLRIPRMHKPIPDCLRINHHHRRMLALIQASGLIHPHLVLQSSRFHGIFQRATQLLGMLIPATGPRSGLIPLVQADKYMVLVVRHNRQSSIPFGCTHPRRDAQPTRAHHPRICENSDLCFWTISLQSKTT